MHRIVEDYNKASGASRGGAVDRKAAADRILDDEITRRKTTGNDLTETTGGRLATSTGQLALNVVEKTRKKEQERAALQRALGRLREYLGQLEQRIAELKIEQEKLQAEADQHFENAENADDLIDDIKKDGMSEAERERAERLLGDEAKGKSEAELIEMLEAYRKQQQEQGRDKAERAKRIGREIEKIENEADQIRDVVNKAERLPAAEQDQFVRQEVKAKAEAGTIASNTQALVDGIDQDSEVAADVVKEAKNEREETQNEQDASPQANLSGISF